MFDSLIRVRAQRAIAVFEESSGSLVAFLDADDTWLPEKLDLQLAWLEKHPDAPMVSGQMIWWHVEGGSRRVVRFNPLSPTRLRRELVIRNVAGNPSMALIRRDAIDKVGIFDTALRWGEDWEFFFRLSRVGEIGFVSEPVIVYRWHRQNLSHERQTWTNSQRTTLSAGVMSRRSSQPGSGRVSEREYGARSSTIEPGSSAS